MRNRYIDGIKKNKLNFVIRYPKSFFLILTLILVQFLLGWLVAVGFELRELPGGYNVRGLFCCLEALIFFLLVYGVKKLHLIVVAAEFQNMFYSNATKALTEFYLIITSEGEVVYKDERTKTESLNEIFGERYTKIMSDIQEGILYHRFYSDEKIIEVVPMMRPKGYFLVAAKRLAEEEVYNALLKEAGISLYKVSTDSVQSKGSSYFGEIGGQDKFLEKTLYKHAEIYPDGKNCKNLFLRNYTKNIGNTHYGVLVPKLVEVKELAASAAIGIAFMTTDLEIISANDAFFEVFKREGNVHEFFQGKAGDLKIGDGPSILNLILGDGDSVRVYLSDYCGFIVGFFVDLSELSGLQRKFQHSQKIVSLGELSGGIAHDFNNILTAILGFAEILLEEVQLESKHYYNIAQIRYGAKKGRDLVKKILAFSRNQTLHTEVLSISDVVRSMRQFIERLVPENIKLTFLFKSGLKNVKVDKTQIEQSLVNLIVNARDAIEGCGEITVEVSNISINKKYLVLVGTQNEEVVLKGEYISILVKDNGCGITKEVICKIFDPFFSTKSVDKGTGLGLSTVYGIIKQMKGYINVESSEGQGSTFTLFIPASYETINEEVKKFKEDLTLSEENRGAKILLVEDEKLVRNFLVKALTKQGFNVVDCKSSQLALESFRDTEGSVDLVVTDVVMPGTDGPEMVREMRKINSELKVLFISGYTRDKLHLDSKNHNEDFIAKPFGINELISKIMKLIENNNSVQ